MSDNALDIFIRESDALIKYEANFNEIRDDVHTVFTLEIRGKELSVLWDNVRSCYRSCLSYLEHADNTEPEDVDATAAKYDATFNAYLGCLAAINEKLSNLKPRDNVSLNSNEQKPAAPVTLDDFCHSFNVPPCNIPVFDSKVTSWPTFRDLFTAVYINNSRVSPIVRLFALLEKTSGDARDLVSKAPLTNKGFDVAWKSLTDKYENLRRLVNHQLMLIFDLPFLDKETEDGLKTLQRGINGFLSAMSTLDISVSGDLSSHMIVFMCIQRLPAITVNFWEQSVKDKKALSLWSDLDRFLTERIETLECSRDLRGSHLSKRSAELKVKTHHTSASTSVSNSCVLCKNQVHFLRSCPRFKSLSVADRYSNVKKFNCCVNCLSRTHEVKNCSSTHSCSKCNKRHHTLLHRDSATFEASARKNNSINSAASLGTALRLPNSAPADPNIQSTSNGGNPTLPSNRQVFHASVNKNVLLGTAMVNIVHQGITYPARALIDPAFESSFISERLVNRLKLPSHSTKVCVSGVELISTSSKKLCSVEIGSPIDSAFSVEALLLVLTNISGNLPSFKVPSNLKDNLPNLRLADSNFYDSLPVDLLLGSELYPKILIREAPRDILGSLIAQNTAFGWIISGPIVQPRIQVYSTHVGFSEDDNLNKNLLRFWELEEAPKRKNLSPSDKYCEQNYKATTRRSPEGRYIVTLPFKPEFSKTLSLGSSRLSVLGQYLRTESSLQRKPEVREMYDNVVREYLDLGHMKPVSNPNLDPKFSCYLPHHPVIKPERKTTKLRVVFNASNKTSNGNSLNDCLYVGPTLQADLVLLILRWRLFKFVFNCDITQMYRQILVDSSHTPFQRILFRNSPTEDVKEYELQTVTFGVNCAPYLAIRTLLQLADDSEAEFPMASHILRRCMYVDDVLTGTHDIPTALIARDQLMAAMASAKFELRKWTSNERMILDVFPSGHLVDEKLLTFEESSSSKTLGIQWNAQMDSFYFNVNPIAHKVGYTKREVLSIIAKLFDPVGWLSPVIVAAKIIMQRIWLDNINWDDLLPLSTENDWQKFIASYHEVNIIRIPRWVHYTPETSAELHVFSDASEKAYAGVIYIRIETSTGEIHTHLLSSKTKVAPIKSISLPRLELCGAVLASDLLRTLLGEIDIQLNQIYCWTDSTIVLSWLRKAPCSWTTFVANRVCRIQENVGNHNWYHVRSEENPADLGSRGTSPSELAASELWWHGPQWLRHDKTKWNISDLSCLNTDIECKVVRTHASFFKGINGAEVYEDLLANYSSLDRALRVLSYALRFINNTHPAHKSGRSQYVSTTFCSLEIKMTKLRLAIVAQKYYFADEYECLLEKKPLRSKSSLVPLNPFLDKDGVIRMNGRLVKSPSLSYTEKHPIILPYSSRFTLLLTEYAHLISIHGGNQLMLRILRIEYWVPRLKSKIRGVISRCKRCIIDRKRSCNQIMAALPPERTTLDRPFTTIGVDFAGPFDIKSFTGRACKITKGYVCVFVCFSTKAIHLEATSDLSTATFLAAFHRFVSRRGCPNTIFSDNGTNFVGASREIERDFKAFIKEGQSVLSSTYNVQGLSWRFIPAGAPHMGGLWEAGVKSFKRHFRKEAQAFKYTFEEFSTVLSRIEACLNSRPLCPMTDNPHEPVALTPGHFLIGSPILAPSEPAIHESPLSLINRFRKMKALSQLFCRRWKEEYLTSLHKRYKWRNPERDLQVNDLVVVRHEQLPPTSWRLGRVIKVYPGSDGHVRVADIFTANGVVKRPITKLVILTN